MKRRRRRLRWTSRRRKMRGGCGLVRRRKKTKIGKIGIGEGVKEEEV